MYFGPKVGPGQTGSGLGPFQLYEQLKLWDIVEQQQQCSTFLRRHVWFDGDRCNKTLVPADARTIDRLIIATNSFIKPSPNERVSVCVWLKEEAREWGRERERERKRERERERERESKDSPIRNPNEHNAPFCFSTLEKIWFNLFYDETF